MKILIFSRSFFNLSETFIYRQVQGASKKNEVFLLGFEFLNEDAFPIDGERVRIKRNLNIVDKILTKVSVKIFGLPYGISVLNYISIQKIIKKAKIDLVHAHFGNNALLIFPLIKFLKLPMVVSFHGVDASPQYLKDLRYKNKLTELFEYVKAIIIVSPHMKETLELAKWSDKTHLIPYGIDPFEFEGRLPSIGDNEVVKILHSGRIVSKKGVVDLINVFICLSKRHSNLRLDIVGDGPLLDSCKQAALESGMVNITFLGAQSQSKVKQMMAKADIFVLNSRVSEDGDMEGLPNAILEAMSMGLPVVSTFHAGIPQAITDNFNGLLVHERDNEGLELAIEKLILNEQLRSRLSKEARKTVENFFTIDIMNNNILGVYEKLSGKNGINDK